MKIYLMLVFFFLIRKIHPVSIPFLQDIFLQAGGYSKSNTTIRLNLTCQQCLCNSIIGNNNYLAMNCYTNETCEYFNTFPTSYKLKSSAGTKLYFLQRIFPNTSTCCRPNINDVFIPLLHTIPKTINLPFSPGAFGYDENQPNEAVVIGMSVGNLTWFNPFNLTLIRTNYFWTALTVELYNGSLFTSIGGDPTIYVLDSQTMTQIINITDTRLTSTRRYIFLNDGKQMIATAQDFNSLAVFNASSSTNYMFQELLSFPFINAHSLFKVNDTFFYASSWQNTTILSYSYNNTIWNYSVFVSQLAGISGSHISVDDCGRIWHVIYSYGLYIYDSAGIQIASWNITLGVDTIYDILLLPNYVVLLTQGTAKQILQYDPQILCS